MMLYMLCTVRMVFPTRTHHHERIHRLASYGTMLEATLGYMVGYQVLYLVGCCKFLVEK